MSSRWGAGLWATAGCSGQLELSLSLDDPPCQPNCDDHGEHVYTICYGKPTMVGDRDYLLTESSEYPYPITHYVGWTGQHPPIGRVRSHGARSANYLVDLRPGTQCDEELTKELGSCPGCGGSLWYYGESPRAAERLEVGDIVVIGQRGRVRYRIVGGSKYGAGILVQVDGPDDPPRMESPDRLRLIEREPLGYLAHWLAWQTALARCNEYPTPEAKRAEKMAREAVLAVAARRQAL